MKDKTHFNFRLHVWDAAGNSIIEQLAALDDHAMAVAAYEAAVEAQPKDWIMCARARVWWRRIGMTSRAQCIER
jgi:hypothetical protein